MFIGRHNLQFVGTRRFVGVLYRNRLRANPTKTQVSLFHLRNRECGKQLNISWNGVNLTHCNLPVYIGVTLARMLSYKAHIEKTKNKVGTRKQNHSKTKNLKMGSDSNHTQVVRSSAMLLSCRVIRPIRRRAVASCTERTH